MTWSYDAALLTSKDKVRSLIGDVTQAKPILTDEQVAFAVKQRGDVLSAAALCCRMAAAAFAREVSTSADGFSSQDNQKAEAFRSLADTYEAEAARTAGGYAGSPFPTDYQSEVEDQEPIFSIGMDDNLT